MFWKKAEQLNAGCQAKLWFVGPGRVSHVELNRSSKLGRLYTDMEVYVKFSQADQFVQVGWAKLNSSK